MVLDGEVDRARGRSLRIGRGGAVAAAWIRRSSRLVGDGLEGPRRSSESTRAQPRRTAVGARTQGRTRPRASRGVETTARLTRSECDPDRPSRRARATSSRTARCTPSAASAQPGGLPRSLDLAQPAPLVEASAAAASNGRVVVRVDHARPRGDIPSRTRRPACRERAAGPPRRPPRERARAPTPRARRSRWRR